MLQAKIHLMVLYLIKVRKKPVVYFDDCTLYP